ncbi:GNAT family N-acetyltransferase [Flavobacteriaceae bacterium]|nr:GNAT family N-acetyltransferase [Flavobacteriaceae bacterium]
MKNRYSGIAKSNDDISSAVSLIRQVFYKNNDIQKFIFPSESLQCQNVVVIKLNERVVAACLIHDRTLYFKGIKISSSFLCNICVDDDFRGQGISKILMDCAIELCKEAGKKVCFVIARKLVDYYYTKFSFFGFSHYPKIVVKNDKIQVNNNSVFLKLNVNSIDEIKLIYDNVYIGLSGSFFRDDKNWEFIIKKAKNTGINLSIIKDSNGLTIGYVCYKDNDIFEIALIDNKQYYVVIKNFMTENELSYVNFHLGINHPIAREITLFDHTISQRNCWFGGHMMRINDKHFFLNMIADSEAEKFQNKIDKLQNRDAFKLFLSQDVEENNLPSDVFNIPLMDQI